jgi:hypothetical protein
MILPAAAAELTCAAGVPTSMKHLTRSFATCAVVLTMLAACATGPTADIRAHSAPDAEFSKYSTFGFPEQTGTDRGGYSTLITSHFKAAVRDQMEQRGYHYVEENPELLVNFYAKVHERTDVRSQPTFSAGYGYYGYRYGLYNAWPLYDEDVRTVTYPVGTVNVDVVDARRKQMIWEGIAQGRVRDEDMNNPREAISRVVTQLFARYPGRAGILNNSRQ